MDGLSDLVGQRYPGCSIEESRVLGVDESPSDATRKGAGHLAGPRASERRDVHWSRS